MAIWMATVQEGLGLLQSQSGLHFSQEGLEEKGREMIQLQTKYISQVNTSEGAEVFKLKDDVGTRKDD